MFETSTIAISYIEFNGVDPFIQVLGTLQLFGKSLKKRRHREFHSSLRKPSMKSLLVDRVLNHVLKVGCKL